MSWPEIVVAISPEAPLSQAVRLMLENRVSGLPVIDSESRLVGMLTEGDLLRRAEIGTEDSAPGWLRAILMPGRLAAEYVQTHGRRVAEVMTSDVVSVEEETPLAEVVSMMEQHRIKRVPVLRSETVVGIVSRFDLVRLLSQALRAPATTEDDAATRRAILAEIARQPWAHTRTSAIAVENGTVLLDGAVFDMREREALRVLVENTPGVKRVVNRLVCIGRDTGVLIWAPEDEEGADTEARRAR